MTMKRHDRVHSRLLDVRYIIGGRVSKTNVAVNERHRPQLESADAEPFSQSVSQSVISRSHPPTPRSPLHPTADRLSIRVPGYAAAPRTPVLETETHNGTESDSLPGAILNCRKCERQSLPADRVLPVAFCTELLGRDCVRLSGWVVGRWPVGVGGVCAFLTHHHTSAPVVACLCLHCLRAYLALLSMMPSIL